MSYTRKIMVSTECPLQEISYIMTICFEIVVFVATDIFIRSYKLTPLVASYFTLPPHLLFKQSLSHGDDIPRGPYRDVK